MDAEANSVFGVFQRSVQNYKCLNTFGWNPRSVQTKTEAEKMTADYQSICVQVRVFVFFAKPDCLIEQLDTARITSLTRFKIIVLVR
jgi:hypothetical protein